MSDVVWAEQMLNMILADTTRFLNNADPDVILEFPYAKSISMPSRIAGREQARAYLENVGKLLPGLTFSDIRVMPLREDGAFLLEYHGVCKEVGNYDQDYITLMRFKGDKITLFREYWDTTEVTRAMSGETAKFSTVSGLPDGEHLA